MTRKKNTIIALVGSMLELYEFAVYVYLSPILSEIFFNNPGKFSGLLLTLTIFAVGFVMRPLGGIYFGHLGDRLGRKTVLTITILMMACATTMIGLLPTAATIGGWAPLLLLILRCVQGFSLGGEFPGGIIYLQEIAPQNRRSLYSGLIWVFGGLSWLFGSGIAACLSYLLDKSALMSWGWRIPFLIGFILGIIGLYLRLKLTESAAFLNFKEPKAKAPLLTAFKGSSFKIVCVLAWYFLPSFSFLLIFSYLPVFLQNLGFFSLTKSLIITDIGIVVFLFFSLLIGYIADYLPQIRTLRIGIVVLFFCGVFAYAHALQNNIFSILITQCLFSFGIACIYAVLPIFMVHYFPLQCRYSALAIILNGGLALGALLLPYLQITLSAQWQQPAIPGFAIGIIAFLGFILTFVMPPFVEQKVI